MERLELSSHSVGVNTVIETFCDPVAAFLWPLSSVEVCRETRDVRAVINFLSFVGEHLIGMFTAF